ncbi:MAG: hypothetical protein IPN22_06535 [Bacteroidetes bacterium]|nr:hypothetical protein [Bacteroidota bacterium]
MYFEVMNEPYGYSADQWKTICKQWLQHYPDVPRARILIGGSGYCQFVNAVASDSAFNGCFFSQHAYAFWFPSVNTVENWKGLADFVVNPYQSRTILTEFGVAMTTGIDYSQPANGDGRIAFLRAMSQVRFISHGG